MTGAPTPPPSPDERLELALDYAWEITKAKFRDGRIEVEQEAPLQHQYAQGSYEFEWGYIGVGFRFLSVSVG
ncbi:MAG: hypothetical protein U5J64_06775 [Halobacteriales archaeon]|nr:hypothetical protein [Halobacteriales archaeon]